MIKLQILNANNAVLAEATGDTEVYLYYKKEYNKGDSVRVVREKDSEIPGVFLHCSLDEVIGESVVYLTEKEMVYKIPFGNERLNISPKAFSGAGHLLSVRIEKDYETNSYRCLSENRWDQSMDTGAYPHAFSNIETRGEVVFAARNVIDGFHISTSHGEWPYTSWGPDLEVKDYFLQVNLGRETLVDRVMLHLRTDFPHDSWWKEGRLSFSDGSEENICIAKSFEGQEFCFKQRKTSWVRFDRLIRDERSDSPFPALMQLQIWGQEIR